MEIERKKGGKKAEGRECGGRREGMWGEESAGELRTKVFCTDYSVLYGL